MTLSTGSIQHNGTKHNDIQHNDTQYKIIMALKHKDTQHNDIQHNGTQHSAQETFSTIAISITTFIIKNKSNMTLGITTLSIITLNTQS